MKCPEDWYQAHTGRAAARAQARTLRGAPAPGTCCTVLAHHLLTNTRVLHSVVRGVSKLHWMNSLVLILLCLQSKGYKSSSLSLAGVAEAGSSLAVLPLRLRLYPCCSHHRNRDASDALRARSSAPGQAVGAKPAPCWHHTTEQLQAGPGVLAPAPQAASCPACCSGSRLSLLMLTDFMLVGQGAGGIFVSAVKQSLQSHLHMQIQSDYNILNSISLDLHFCSCSLCQPRRERAMQ